MATIYQLKPAFQALLRPLCRGLARIGVTANQITLLALVGSCIVGGLIVWKPEASWPLLIVPPFLFVRMALNAIDGMLAREHNQKTPLGAILNELGDVVSDSAILLPLAFTPFFPELLMVLITLLSVISEMSGVVALQIGASRRYDGPSGKSDRAFIFGVLCLAAGCGAPGGQWVEITLIAVIALLVLTILNRSRKALKERSS